jgi:hypothetical protein
MVKSYALSNQNSLQENYLTKTENQIGGYLDYSFGNVHLNVFGGYSVGSSYRIYSEDDKVDLAISILKIGDDRAQLNQKIEDGFILKASMYFRIHTNK